MQHITITSFSSALFSTWIFVEEFGLLFDAGDGVSAGLGQKSRKVRHIFITHADRDHVCGLLQLYQLNAADGNPAIHYPRDCGSFPALRDFMTQFDPRSGPASWTGIGDGDRVEIARDTVVRARLSDHVVAADSATKALDYTVQRTRRTLHPALHGRSGAEIAELRAAQGEDAVSRVQVDSLLGYSGDAAVLDAARWADVRVLVHECTFLEPDTARRQHANLPQVMAAAAELDLQALVLMHFSTRYSATEIAEAVTAEADTHQPRFPIYTVMPGAVARDILAATPTWRPG
jgi:ribonuclease Z